MSLIRVLKLSMKLCIGLHSSIHTVTFISLLSISIVFWSLRAVPGSKLKNLFNILDRLPVLECPSQYYVYHLHDNEKVYSLQIEVIGDTKRELAMCRVHDLHADYDLDLHQGQEDVASNLHEINSPEELDLIRELCGGFVYNSNSAEGVKNAGIDAQSLNPDVIDVITYYKILMEQTQNNGNDIEPESQVVELSALTSLLQRIYPGTKWCGFKNIARDVHSDLGTEPDVDACFRRHNHCRPLVNPLQHRYAYYNPSILPVSHCKCDIELYNCFRKTGNPVADKIAHIFFNLVSKKCFDFGIRHFCSWKLFGVCLFWEKKCAAIMRSNKKY